MTHFRRTLSGLFLSSIAAVAQPVVVAPAAPPAASPAMAPAALRSPEQLDQLLAPIALYPDALIALILPAATASTDIVLAARHLRDFPDDRSQIEHRAWDESVKSLTNYPEVLLWMDENLPWTKQVGEAFAEQPADVMQSVQRLRGQARAAGTLVDTPQQLVLAEPEVIRIVPAQPDVIYVPRYDPDVVFVDRYVYSPVPLFSFGVGVSVGSWLAYDCDWRRRTIWIGDRHRAWHGHDWRRPLVPISPGVAPVTPIGFRQWRPPAHVSRPVGVPSGPRLTGPVYRPRPFDPTRSPPRRPGPDDRRQQPAFVGPLPATSSPASPATAPATPSGRSYPSSNRSSAQTPRPSTHTSTQLYVTDRGSATAPAASAPTSAPAPAAAPNPSLRATTPGPRDRGSYNRTYSAPAASAPVMGPQPASPAPVAAPGSGPRLESRSHRGDYTRGAPAPVAAPAPPPAANPTPSSRPPASEVTPPPPANSAPAPQRPSGDRSGRRGENDAQR